MKISFVIPFHNEEKNCLPMIKRIISYARGKSYVFEVVPVDDRSTDNTGRILKELAKKYSFVRPVYRKEDKEGKGNTMGKALLEGSKKSKGQIVIWTMGDLSDSPDTYGEIVKKIKSGYDMVFGSRYMSGGSRGNLDEIKAFLSSWGTKLARFMFGVPVHDITNAFRGFRRELIENIELDSSGFSISPEFAIKAYLMGFKLGEVPTVYTNRIEGVSSFKLFKMTKSYLKIYFKLYLKYKLFHSSLDFTAVKDLN